MRHHPIAPGATVEREGVRALPEAKAASAAPEVLAVVDIGSNSIRMVVAQMLPDGKIDILERLQRPVRLGQDAFRMGRLRTETMRSAISILRDYRSVLNTYGVSRVRAVATTALRESANSDTFIDRAVMATGFEVSVISVAEEGRLSVSAVRRAINEQYLQQGNALVVEVGGGGTIMSLLHNGEVAASQSLPIGSVRMQEVLSTSTETPSHATRLIQKQISSAIATFKGILPLKSVQTFIAVGGDARWAASQVGRTLDEINLRVVSREALEDLLGTCGCYTADELARTHHISFIDAETIIPALYVYQMLLKTTGAKEMIVADVSMRDGILWDMACSASGQDTDLFYQETIQSAQGIGQKYCTDMAHAQHTRMLAARLFDALAAEHRLGSRHRLLLEVAGLVHEIGTFVSSRAHHKHSQYLVANSEILGLTQDELAIVANVARYHRRSRPKPSHMEYMSMSREGRTIVNKLAAILRVADALDVSRTQQIRELTCRMDNNGFVIAVPGGMDLLLERRSLAEKADMFQDIYGLDVRIEETG